MIKDYEEIQKRIRPVFLHDKELKEAGSEDAACELLRTLQLELNTLDYTRQIIPHATLVIYGAILDKAFKMGYEGAISDIGFCC
jgi:hypothetical protein